MASDVLAETAYFPGEFLSAADYAGEQAYQIDIQRAGAAAINDWGIVSGLLVAPGTGGVVVSTGLAIDGRGRLLLLTSPSSPMEPPAGEQWLVIEYQELEHRADSGGVSSIIEEPVLRWIAHRVTFDPSLQIPLCLCVDGALKPMLRIYAGVNAGGFTFKTPSGRNAARLLGWSAAPRAGLRIETDTLAIAPQQTRSGGPGSPTLGISWGSLGVGVMSPEAYLDVLAPSAALTGPGVLTSFDTLVRGTGAALEGVLHVGDIVLVTDREGHPTESAVVSISSGGDLRTASPLNCVDAPFVYERALTVSVRSKSVPTPAAFNITREAYLGFGVDAPTTRLDVGGGDILLPTANSAVRFLGDGTITTEDESSVVRFQTAPPELSVNQTGDIRWLPGQVPPSGVVTPHGMTLTSEGAVGVGTLQPTTKLDVIGSIQLVGAGSGLIFPDGSVQTTGETSIPIGSIIDWWQGAETQSPPNNYMICAGGTVTDPESPLHGAVLPNLANLMVFGAANDAQATTITGADTHSHRYETPSHVHAMPHTHPDLNGTTGSADHDDGMAGAPDNNAAAGHAHTWKASVGEADSENTKENSDVGQVYQTDAASTLPPYVNLLKLIRVK